MSLVTARRAPGAHRSHHQRLRDPLALKTGRKTSPTERIAAAVILQAVKDCSHPTFRYIPQRGKDGAPLYAANGRPKTYRQRTYVDDGSARGPDAATARAFLTTPNAALTFWCAALGIHADYIRTNYLRNVRASH